MKSPKTDLRYLKWSLLAFAVSLFIGGSTIWLSNDYLTRTFNHLQNAQNKIYATRENLSATQNDLENISTYASEYASLLERKIIADEQRLDWMEYLERLRQQYHLANLKYTISPQQPYVKSPTLNTGNIEVNLSSINLQTDLLHEMQLLNLFGALRSAKKGWFIVERCTLERIATNNQSALATDSQLKADCRGDWITMKHRSTP